jgi:chromosome segregation ATPase
MNAEEMERAIEFLLKHQADFESRQARLESRQAGLETQLEKTSSQIEETNKHLEIHAETQTEFIKIVTQQIEAQGAINTALRASLARMDERINQTEERINQADERLNRTDEHQNQTDARLDRLAALVEQHIGGG